MARKQPTAAPLPRRPAKFMGRTVGSASQAGAVRRSQALLRLAAPVGRPRCARCRPRCNRPLQGVANVAEAVKEAGGQQRVVLVSSCLVRCAVRAVACYAMSCRVMPCRVAPTLLSGSPGRTRRVRAGASFCRLPAAGGAGGAWVA